MKSSGSQLAAQRLVLLSAGTLERRRSLQAQARIWASEVDWAELARALRDRRLLPVLGPRIVQMADGRADEEFEAALAQASHAAKRHSSLILLVCDRVLAALLDVGIRATPLKGPALGALIYGDPGKRLSSDIDLLVAPEDLAAAVDAVKLLEYASPRDAVEANGLPLLHFSLEHERGELPPVELHWRVHWYEREFAAEKLLPPGGSSDGWRPAPVDELACLLLFYARDGFADLRLASDLSAWWDMFGADVPPSGLDTLIGEHPALGAPIRTALAVAEKLVGLPAARVIDAHRPLGWQERAAARLANPNPRSSQAQIQADIGLADALLMPKGELRAFIRRHVVLPREVFDQYKRLAPAWSSNTRVDYGLRVLMRYLVSALKILRPDEAMRA